MEDYFDKIEDYLANAMSEEERASFEADIAQNKALKDAVEAHRLAHDAMEVMIENNLRGELEKMQTEVYPLQSEQPKEQQKGRVIGLRRLMPRLAAAASILLLIGFFTFQWAGGNYSDSALAADFYQTDAFLDDAGIRGASSESTLTEGFELLQKEQYNEALTVLDAIPADDEYFMSATYLKEFGLLQLGKRAEARQALELVLSMKNQKPNLADKAEWLYLLMYLNAEETDNPEFKALLEKITNDPDHSYHDQAVKLKKQLASFWRGVVGS